MKILWFGFEVEAQGVGPGRVDLPTSVINARPLCHMGDSNYSLKHLSETNYMCQIIQRKLFSTRLLVCCFRLALW